MHYYGFFFQVINMSITGGLVILAVLALRLFLRKAPRLISYCLWAVVLFRLLCPFSFSLPVSLLETVGSPAAEEGSVRYISEDFLYGGQPTENLQPPEIQPTGVKTPNMQPTEDGNSEMKEAPARGTERRAGDMAGIGMVIWAGGMLLMLIYAVGQLIVLLRKLRGASPVDRKGLCDAEASPIPDNVEVYEKRGLPTPFVLGVFRPKVYLPSGMDQTELRYILVHEGIHIRRGDHIIKLVSFFALCLHWFNPLVWAAFFLSGRDMEMSCDEAVLRRLGDSVKKDYSASLLNMAAGRKILGVMPLAFSEGDTESRIRNVLKYRKPRRILICIGSAAALAAAVLLLANPAGGARGDEGREPENEEAGGQRPDSQSPEDQTDSGQESDGQTGGDQTPEDQAGSGQTGNDQEVSGSEEQGAETEAARQIAAYQAMRRGEEFVWETLEQLMAEDKPLLESYAGYDGAVWMDEEPYMPHLEYSLRVEEPEAVYRLLVSYRREDNSVDMVYLLRAVDHSVLNLYYRENWRETDVKQFVSHLPALSDWVRDYTLPKRDQLFAEHFSANVGTWGGQIFTWTGETETEARESVYDSPEEWRSAAAIYRTEAEGLVFSGGVLSDVLLMDNHCGLAVLEPVKDCEEQALLCGFECDLLTASEIGEAEEAGIILSEEETTGRFWYVCFGREQSEYGYVLMLSQKYFTREEAIAAAQSVRFTDTAW